MGIAGILLCLASSSKVEVIPMSRSALDFTAESKNYIEGGSTKNPTGKPSRRKTYLIDDGACSKQEIDHVLPYIASAKILFLTHMNRDKTWTTWLPDGTIVKNPKFTPPWDHFRRIFDFTPINGTFIVWSQSKFTSNQRAVMKKGFHEDPFDGVADGVVVTFNGIAFPVVDGRKNFWDQEDWGWGPTLHQPPEFADIPFWIESRVDHPRTLVAKVGSTLKLGKAILKLESFRDPDDDVFPTRAQISLNPPQPNRTIELTPVVDWKEREAKYGSQFDTANKARFRIASGYNRINPGRNSFEVSATTSFKNWRRIEVRETIRMVGYFGHVQTHPNGIHFPSMKIQD